MTSLPLLKNNKHNFSKLFRDKFRVILHACFLVCFIFILKTKEKKPNNRQYGVITTTKTRNNTPPMPCTSLEAEKAPFPLLTLFSLVVNKNKKMPLTTAG